MPPRFTPSVNVARDGDRDLVYIPTANARRIYSQLLQDYAVGVHAFNIIGSYGTGKSAFIWAFEKTLNGDERYFPPPNGQIPSVRGFDFINIVGGYESMVDVIADHLQIKPTEQTIFAELERRYQAAQQQQRGLAVVIDEFGKLLEFAARTNPEKNLYFIQQLAEYINDSNRDMLLLTVLHQNFSTYAIGLDREQRTEWEKVKGRLKELTFNEPVEQLLELASSYTSNGHHRHTEAELHQLVDTIAQSAILPYQRQLTSEWAENLLPFDVLAASVLTQALQRYGQNERSLFTFLNTNDYYGINDYNSKEHPFYNLVCVHDYLHHNFSPLLFSVHNPHYTQWQALRSARERVDASIEEDWAKALKLVKVIGLLNIFAPEGARVDEPFLANYSRIALGFEDAEDVLRQLESQKIIRYRHFKNTFILFDGTDLNVELSISEAEEQVGPVGNLVDKLEQHFTFPLKLAKAETLKKGTPRFFEFRLSREPVTDTPDGVIDGFINLVFHDGSLADDTVLKLSQEHPAVLYGVYHNASTIEDAIAKIEQIDFVIHANQDDRVAVRWLRDLRADEIERLNQETLDSLYDGSSVSWFWNGQPASVPDQKALNSLLSTICTIVYPATPVFRNELINRHQVSSSVATARRYFFRTLVQNWREDELDFPANHWPSQKAIYLTLLKKTGIHRQTEDGQHILDEPSDKSFQILWHTCEAFLESTKGTPKYLSQLVDILAKPPYKLKDGFIGFWIPTFSFAKREEFALYHDGIYVPEVNEDTLDLIYRAPHEFRVKKFAVDGVRLYFFNRYRLFLQQSSTEIISNTGFIETIRPFLTFYRGLPPYAQNTQRLGEKTLRLRTSIAQATDPEQTFFEEFPAALGFPELAQHNTNDETVEAFVQQLQESIRELRDCYDNLVDRIERFLLEQTEATGEEFPDYKDHIADRYETLKTHMLLPQQRTLYMRLTSPLDDRYAWLNSVVQTVLGRDIRRMRDDDEEVVYERIALALQELDNLCELDELDTDPERELPPVSLEITMSGMGSQKILHRLPKQKEKEVQDLEKEFHKLLTGNRTVDIGALIRLLQRMVEND